MGFRIQDGCAAGIGPRPASSGSSPVQDLAAVNGTGKASLADPAALGGVAVGILL